MASNEKQNTKKVPIVLPSGSNINPMLREFEECFLRNQDFDNGNLDKVILVSPELYGVCMEHKERLSAALGFEILEITYFGILIHFIAKRFLDYEKIRHAYRFFDIGVPEQYKSTYPLDRMDVKSHIPSEITTEYTNMNKAISIHRIENNTWNILEKLTDNLHLASVGDTIRLGIFRFFVDTKYYWERYHTDMDVMLEPYFIELWRFVDDRYIKEIFKSNIVSEEVEGFDECEVRI